MWRGKEGRSEVNVKERANRQTEKERVNRQSKNESRGDGQTVAEKREQNNPGGSATSTKSVVQIDYWEDNQVNLTSTSTSLGAMSRNQQLKGFD